MTTETLNRQKIVPVPDKPTGQLRWACRRGMLELDWLLAGFLDNHYCQLSPLDQSKFVELLALSDQLLFDFFWGSAQPDDEDLCRVVKAIRSATAT